MRRRILYLCVVFLVGSIGILGGLVVPAWPQETIDPQSLVGEWQGSWTNQQGAGRAGAGTGDYFLTIERVEGNQVYGRGKIRGPKGTNEFDVVGTLDGNQLRYGKQPATKLLIRKGEMTGTSEGKTGREITLYKRK